MGLVSLGPPYGYGYRIVAFRGAKGNTLFPRRSLRFLLIAAQGDQIVGHGVKTGMHYLIVHGEDKDVMKEPRTVSFRPLASLQLTWPARLGGDA